MYDRSGTAKAEWQMLHDYVPGGSTFLREMTSQSVSCNYDIKSKIKFHLGPI